MPADTPIRFLFRFLQGSILIAVFSVFLSSAAILLGVGLIGTSSYLISYAALQPSIAVLSIPIVGVRFFGISKSLFRYMERLASHEVNFRILGDLRLWIYKQFIPRVPFLKSTDRTGDLLSRAVEDVEVLEFFFIRVVNPPLTALFTSLVVAIFLGRFHADLWWTYLGLAGGSITLSLVVSYLVIARTSRSYLARQADLHTVLVDYFDGLPDLIVNRAADQQMDEIRHAERSFNQSQMRSAWGNGMVNGLLLLLANASMMVMLIVGIELVQQGELSGILLAVVTLITLVSFDGIQPLNLAAQQFHLSKQAAERILSLTAENPQPNRHTSPEALQSSPGLQNPVTDGLELRDIRFRYQPDSNLVLGGIDLAIPNGKKIAIVGPSGSGKTTLARLLLKYWRPESGEIHINGKPYEALSEKTIRNQIGYSGPNPFFFNASLRETITFVKPDMTDGEMIRLFDQVGLQEWFGRLPNGLDSLIGERGMKMSEGERRRLDLTRLLVLDRPILILDEPYANQDIHTQSLLADTLRSLHPDKTLLLITHRLFQLDWMDQIIVLDGGLIREEGTLNELLENGGLFRQMWDQQRQILFEPRE